MGLGKVIFVGALAIFVYGLYANLSKPTKKYVPPASGYYGRGAEKPDDPAIKPFKINVPEETLKDLKDRLRNSRIGHEQLEDAKDFSYGFNLKTLLEFKDHWLNKYDWRKYEAILNGFPQYKTQIEGLQIHFLHVKPDTKRYKKTVPLLLVHGWPGNVFEFYKIIPMLVDPQNHGINSDLAFEVIAPSIPGYGWSEAAHKRGLSTVSTARIFNKLMTDRLKIKRYFAQGGDWGSAITSNIARFYPENLYGLHLNMLISNLNLPTRLFKMIFGSYFPSLVWSQPEYAQFSLSAILVKAIKESGYMHLQATKPDTAGVSLNDSPIGLLAYIGEKFSGWTNDLFESMESGGLEERFTKDEILTIITIYWVNQNILPSQRFYREFFANSEIRESTDQYISVPTGFTAFPHDLISPPPVELVRLSVNLTHYKMERDGGHFAAFEVPKILAREVFAFAKKLYR
ncbi:Epoxide hydrolase [Aphelenchoides besseyi]|nr:Epoxide hydrolase [Aphelenchoides besseyi]